jgi:hypothetical protein
MTMNGAAHEKAPRTALNEYGATFERLKHLVDVCITNGADTRRCCHTLPGDATKHLQLG